MKLVKVHTDSGDIGINIEAIVNIWIRPNSSIEGHVAVIRFADRTEMPLTKPQWDQLQSNMEIL